MKKQVLSLLLAGALTLGLFGCSAQTPEESGVPQSAPAQTEGTDSAGVVEELKIGICTVRWARSTLMGAPQTLLVV